MACAWVLMTGPLWWPVRKWSSGSGGWGRGRFRNSLGSVGNGRGMDGMVSSVRYDR